MVDEFQSDNLHQPMNQPKKEPGEDRPQPVQSAHDLERSELSRADSEEKISALGGEQAEERQEEAEETNMDEGGSAVAAGRRRSSKRKPGRPRLSQGRTVRAPPKPKDNEEALCFICFDGGDLVVCEHRNCPKVYHPECVNRDEAYFKAKGQWTCGWHICSNCQKSAQYMCYTCTYSLCKRCINIQDTGFACVKGIKGFCGTCMKMVMLIETNNHTDETMDMLDFDDKTSWLSLFKDYWIDLKAKFSLTLEELTRARNPFKEMHAVSPLESLDKSDNASDDRIALTSKSSSRSRESTSSRKKGRKRSRNMADIDVAGKEEERAPATEDVEWASKELLQFVAHVKNGDISVLSQYDVLKLVHEYIEQHKLWDPPGRSRVICDSRLQSLFGRSQTGHLEMLKLLEPHFLVKEASALAAVDNQGGVVDPDPTQMDADGDSDASPKATSDLRWKSVKEKDTIKLDDYAAIDVHNVSLMYLRRNLMEELLDDTENFNLNILGSFIRIRISGLCQDKDMYRLVQIVGTGKAAEKYKISKKMTDITLQIINLNKKEFITIDVISNQDFTEGECRRLRQSVKCGLLGRLTVAEVHEKARVLQSVRVNNWLENEKSKLSKLRDRASKKGHVKEHRECVEKLQLLSMPEERDRRLNEVHEIHVDPHMDPSYESAEEDVKANKQVAESNIMHKSSTSKRNEFSAAKGGCATSRSSDTAQDSVRITPKPGLQDIAVSTTRSIMDCNTIESLANEANLISQVISSPTLETESNITSVGSGILDNAQPSIKSGESSGNPPQAAPQPLSADTVSTNRCETEKMWHYQDPSGKTQGPFSMAKLRTWNSNGFFPSDLKIWRTSEKQEDSILLTDVLNRRLLKDWPQREPQSYTKSSTGIASTVVSKVNGWEGVGRGSNNPQIAVTISSNNCNVPKSDSLTDQLSANIVDERSATSSSGRESSNNANSHSEQTEEHNTRRPMAAFLRNSSQPPNYQNRDGRKDYNSKRDGNCGRFNNWNSDTSRRFQHKGGGFERQHSYRSSSSQQIPREQWNQQLANVCPTNMVSNTANINPNQIGGGSNGSRAPQPLNLGWGMAPRIQNPGPVQGIGNVINAAIPGATNIGWGLMLPPGAMNMAWGAPSNINMVWGPPAQAPTDANPGSTIPQEGNNLAWGAQMPANPSSGWVMPMPANPSAGWVMPMPVMQLPNFSCTKS